MVSKDAPQEWEDIVLPLFDQPGTTTPRVRSRKEQDDAANKIIYSRYKGPAIPCRDCVLDRDNRTGISTASWLRRHGPDERVLCYHHKAEYLAREQ